MQEKTVEEQVKETTTTDKTITKPQHVNKYTPRKPEKKIVVDITGDVAKEKVHLHVCISCYILTCSTNGQVIVFCFCF